MSVVLERRLIEGPDPRAVPERRLARPARLVRDPRRGRGGAAVLRARTSPTSRWPKRRRSPASSSRRPRCRRSTTRSARRSAATSCCGRWPTPASSRGDAAERAVREPLQIVGARARGRGAVLRRLHQPGAAGRNTRPPAPSTSTRRSTSTCSGSRRMRVRDGLDARRRDARAAQAAARAGGADRRRPAHRRDPRVRRRPLLQPVAVQPRRQRAPAAGIGVQAVRLPRGVRARAGRGPHRPHAGDGRPRRADDVRRSTSRPGRRATTTASTTARSRCAARWRCRATSPTVKVAEAAGYDEVAGAVAAGRRRHAAAAVSVDRARRVRGDAVRDRHRLHAVPQRRHDPAAARDLAARRRRARTCRSRPPTPRTVARPDTTFLVTNMMRSVHQRGHRRRRARGRLRARRRRQVGHDQRPARRLVRRLHARAADGGLGRPRRQPAASA